MKKLLSLIPVLILMFFSINQIGAQMSNTSPIKNVEAHEAKKVVDSGKYFILDIRTPGEFNQSHIEGAINIDFYKKSFMDNLSELDRDKAYFLYCRSGNRTGQSLRLFKSLGFKNIVHLQRGIVDWTMSGYEMVK